MTGMSLFACGEAWENKYFYFFLCQDKQTMELIGGRRKLGSFLLQLWQSTVEGKDFLSWSEKIPQVPGPALGSLQAGSAWDVLHKELKTFTFCSFSGFSLNCLQMHTRFPLKDTSIPQLAPTNMGMSRWPRSPLSFQGFLLLSSFSPFFPSVRCICSFLSCVTVKRTTSTKTPFFWEHLHHCRNVVLHFRSHRHILRVILRGDGGNALSPPWVHSAQDNWPFPPGHNWAGFEVVDQPLPWFGCLAHWAVLLHGCFSQKTDSGDLKIISIQTWVIPQTSWTGSTS